MPDEPNLCESPGVFQGDLLSASDNELAQELMRENHEALAIILDRYQRLVFTIAFRIVRDIGEAEDLVQDIFLQIYRKVKLFDPSKGIFKVWLMRCAYTTSLKRRCKLARKRFYASVALDEALPVAIPWEDSNNGLLLHHEASRFVNQALSSLGSKQRKAVDLIAIEGLTLKEAAERMGYSIAATRNYYFRGVMALRAFNSKHAYAPEKRSVDEIGFRKEARGVGHIKTQPA
jgi:RNA polymerase sigma-70 factor (ECF subfamily)